MPPAIGHLCLQFPSLSPSAALLDPLEECWRLSGEATRSAPLSAFPRFLLPSAGQKQSTAVIKPILLPSAPNQRTKLIGKHYFQWMKDIVECFCNELQQSGTLGIFRRMKSSTVNQDKHSIMRPCFLQNKESSTLNTTFTPHFLLKPFPTHSSPIWPRPFISPVCRAAFQTSFPKFLGKTVCSCDKWNEITWDCLPESGYLIQHLEGKQSHHNLEQPHVLRTYFDCEFPEYENA